MMLSLIVALDRHGLIGRAGGLPWHLPADLQHFKALTMAKPVIMGRKTFESIGRPLPGRRNIILTRDADYRVEGVEVFYSAEAVLSALTNSSVPEAVVIGGAEIYRVFLPAVRRMYVTRVEGVFEGDTWFPAWPPGPDWDEKSVEQRAADEKNPHDMTFFTYEKLEKF